MPKTKGSVCHDTHDSHDTSLKVAVHIEFPEHIGYQHVMVGHIQIFRQLYPDSMHKSDRSPSVERNRHFWPAF